MTPAINVLNQSGSVYELHQFHPTGGAHSYGREAARQLAVEAQRLFKTLLVRLESGAFVVALVPVSGQLDLKKLAQIIGERKACLAEFTDVPRITGYLPGASAHWV
ncbi:YbaK/EbsC family protein [Salinimonas marina]|uniref:YbaK/EbsC family protein n=1 Tax=Salinimonas marina TaxID=2785918 RepID=UPI001C5526BB|nr:YbaK/EbsC family protein [Salinimonas marina]